MRRRGLAAGLAVGIVLMTAACSVPTAASGGRSGGARPPASSPAPHATAPITLACDQSQPVDTPGPATLGVSSEIWDGSAQSFDLKTLKDFTHQDMATMLSAASSAVVVGGCDGARQFPGGIIVAGPACVTLRILPGGDANQQATVSVPIGTRCST